LIGRRKKKLFLYLQEQSLVGVKWEMGKVKKVIDTQMDQIYPDTQIFRGEEAVLILDKQKEIQHQILSFPTPGKINLKKLIEYEVQSLMDAPSSELVYDYRFIGSSQEEGTSMNFYLIGAYRRKEILPWLEKLAWLGLNITKITTPLDILIEKGRKLNPKGGSGLMVFEDLMVHFLFFRNGVYGFQRTFELQEEGFQKDLILELQRSFFYAKQKFKLPIEKVSILLAPEWIVKEGKIELEEALGVPIEIIPPVYLELWLPEIKLLNTLINDVALLPPLLNLLPAEIIRERGVQKFSWALSFTELVILGLMLIWTYINQEALKRDLALLQIQNRQLQSLQVNLQNQQEKLNFIRKLIEESKIVKTHIKEKRNIYLVFEALPFLIPENVYLESITWGSLSSEQPTPHPPPNLGESASNLMVLQGKVDSSAPEEKYSLFFQFLKAMESSPFIERVNFQTEELLSQGKFQINAYLKRIESNHEFNQ